MRGVHPVNYVCPQGAEGWQAIVMAAWPEGGGQAGVRTRSKCRERPSPTSADCILCSACSRERPGLSLELTTGDCIQSSLWSTARTMRGQGT